MHPKRGRGVPLGERHVAGRDEAPGPVATSPAYRRLMGLPEPPRPPLSLDRQHVMVETGEGPAAGLLVELAGDRARVMFVRHPEDATLMETWVHVDDVVEVDAPPPV